jgi:hypothetical protein
MAYVHGYTNSGQVLKDLANTLSIGATDFDPSDNLTIVFPNSVNDITDKVIFNVKPSVERYWVKREVITVQAELEQDYGVALLLNDIVEGGGVRVELVEGSKRVPIYLKPEGGDPDAFGFTISETRAFLKLPQNTIGKQVNVDYEIQFDLRPDYYLKLEKPALTNGGLENNFYIQWSISNNFDEELQDLDSQMSIDPVKLHFFKETAQSAQLVGSWLPIEYWLSFDKSCITGVLMGDPAVSEDFYVSTPFYFGSLKQIEGALDTDMVGNFGGFSGGLENPTQSTKFGQNTANGITDVSMISTKSGAPFYRHNVSIFGCSDYSEYVLSGVSSHTRKHSVSDIVVGSKHENDRGILRRTLAVPKASKEHGAELIYQRYISGKEERYIFLNINTPYMPFGVNVQDKLGFAIKMDF